VPIQDSKRRSANRRD